MNQLKHILRQKLFSILSEMLSMAFYKFKGFTPVSDPSSFVHPLASVIGNVVIGKNCYIGPGAALRGDWGEIILEDGCNVQENCVVHMFPGVTVLLKEASHIGHGAIIHGATIGRNCLVGMNTVVMDNVELGDECIVGAMSFVKEGTKIAPRSLVAGNPAKILKQVSKEMIDWKTKGTKLYQELPAEMFQSFEPCEPLHDIPKNRPTHESLYTTWNKIKSRR